VAACSVESNTEGSWCNHLESSGHASQRTTISKVFFERRLSVAGTSTQNGPSSSKCVHQSVSSFFRKNCTIGKSNSWLITKLRL